MKGLLGRLRIAEKVGGAREKKQRQGNLGIGVKTGFIPSSFLLLLLLDTNKGEEEMAQRESTMQVLLAATPPLGTDKCGNQVERIGSMRGDRSMP